MHGSFESCLNKRDEQFERRSLRTDWLETVIRLLAPFANLLDADSDGLGYINPLFLHVFIAIERGVARRIRFVITDETIETRFRPGFHEPHPVEPVGQTDLPCGMRGRKNGP
jgi:hypothetical protein